MCQERAGFGLWFLPLTALCECSTEQCCGALCSYRRTRGLSHLCESACTLWSCGLTGSSLPMAQQVLGALTQPRVPVSLWRLTGSSLSPGGAMAQQVPVQAIQVHQAPQQTSPSSDSSTDLTQTSSSGTDIGNHPLSAFLTSAESNSHQHAPCPLPGQFPSSGTFSQAY